MAAGSSKFVVVLALLGNSVLTVTKFIAFLLSGSGAMLSECVHSLADTANQALLFLGIRKSEKLATAQFPYGFGADRYFFALMSAVGIFVLGCGVTIYHGVHTLLQPPELQFSWVIWVTLAIAAVVDGVVLRKAWHTVAPDIRRAGARSYFRHSTDPTVLAVLFEDGVALLGVLVAAVGIGLSYLLGSSVPDALASITIGLMMGAIAIWLGVVNRGLILGRAIPKPIQDELAAFLREQPGVRGLRSLRSRVLGADRFRLQAEIEFDGSYLGRRQVEWITAQAPDLSDPAAVEAFASELGHRLVEDLGDEVDRIEKELGERFPRVKYIDLEAD